MRYVRVDSVEQAVEELTAGSMPLAGGTVVVPRLRSGLAVPAVVDLSRIPGLDRVVADADYVEVGAMCRLDRLTRPPFSNFELLAVSRAAEAVGNPHVRRSATLGGNVVVGAPTSDLTTALLALDARVLIADSAGVRERPIDALSTVENPFLVTGVRIPVRTRWRSHFVKFAWRRASGKTIVNVAVALRLENGLSAEARVAVGGYAGGTLHGTARSLAGVRIGTEETSAKAAGAAVDEMTWSADAPVSETYGRRCVAHGIERLLTELQ